MNDILIVDDHADTRRLLSITLGRQHQGPKTDSNLVQDWFAGVYDIKPCSPCLVVSWLLERLP